MSEPLYRIVPLTGGLRPPYLVVRRAQLTGNPVAGQLVPVEPGTFVPVDVPVECEHGNTGEHVIRDQKRTYHPSELCPGEVTDDE